MVSNIVNLRPTTIPSVKATVNALSPTFGTQKQWDRYMIKFIVSLLHCYSMKLYSRRKVQRIKEVLLDDEQNED